MKPIILTRQKKANAAAEMWAWQYGPQAQYHNNRALRTTWFDAEKEEIHRQLVALGPTPDPNEVERIIGNDTWTSPGRCDGCGEMSSLVLVRVGDEPDYDSNTADLCPNCLEEAWRLLQGGINAE